MRRGGWMMVFVAMMHLWWGTSMLLEPTHGDDWHGGVAWNVFVNLGGIKLWAWLLVVAAALAFWAVWRGRSLLALIALIPQQIVVTLGVVAIAMHLGGAWHEFEASRIWRVAGFSIPIFVCHTLEIMEFYGINLWTPKRKS